MQLDYLLMLFDCKLNGRLSSNVDGHVDNYLLMLCSMPLTIIIRLVLKYKKKPAMGNSKIKWNFKKNKNLKVELNTVCQWLVVCLKFM